MKVGERVTTAGRFIKVELGRIISMYWFAEAEFVD